MRVTHRAGVVTLVAVLAAACSSPTPPRPAAPPIPGVSSYTVTSRDHVEGTVDYPENPPVGGAHNPVWMNCGFYREPVRTEMAVHSMEHGAVWITYSPDLPADQVQILREFARRPFVLVTPYEPLPAPVVASAWGLQLRPDGAADPRLAAFVETYANGPQTPEPGAPCDRGAGDPEPG